MNQIRQFEMVMKIAGCRSISHAAKELGMAQPTLSKYLASIEEQVGQPLFDRATLPIRLTQAGERYLHAGSKILDARRQLDKELEEMRSTEKTIVVGCSPTRSSYIFARILTEFRALNPGAKVIVRERNTRQLNDELTNGELDLIISLQNDSTRSFRRVELFAEKILLAVPKPMACGDAMEILRACPTISTGANLRLGRLLAQMLEYLHAPAPLTEMQSIESAYAMAKAGLGVTLVPNFMARHEKTDQLVFLELPELFHSSQRDEIERSVCIFFRHDQALTPVQTDFIRACRQSFSDEAL